MKGKHVITKIIFAILAALVILCGVLLLLRFIRRESIRKKIAIQTENGIEEEVIVKAGGINQYLNIRGQDVNNPILLVLHGGMPVTPVFHTYQTVWEENYTVVNLDRRGYGETYFLNKENYREVMDTMTVEQYKQDIYDVIVYLQDRFQQDKVILMGDSLGTIIGSQFVLEHPEMISAYIGSAQLVDTGEDFRIFKEELLENANKENRKDEIEELTQVDTDLTVDNFVKSLTTLNKYGTKYVSKTGGGASMFSMILAGMQSPYFPLSHLSFYMKSDELCASAGPINVDFNAYDNGTDYQVPVIFIYGKNDWITRYCINDYFDNIDNTQKQIFRIDGAGHDVMQEYPKEFYEAFNEALKNLGIQ